MDHVSTLCALSTIGIATTGLALGRVERTKQSNFRRKSLPPGRPLPTPSEPTAVDVRPKTSRSARPRPAGADCIPDGAATDTSDGSHQGQCQGSDLRRASLSFGAARLRRRGQTLTNPPLRIPENEPIESQPRRPSTGWLRRLSIVSFQSESPSASSPVTPSFNGSASPILPRPSSQRKTPNKLIKRSSSQHSNVHPLFINTAVFPASALRRPATSHQRSETMRLNSPLTDFESRVSDRYSVESPQIEEFEVNSQNDWRPYLLPRPEGFSERLTRRLPTAGSPKGQGVRRIVSDQDTVPALVLATTVTTKKPNPPDNPSVAMPQMELHNPFQADQPVFPSVIVPQEKPVHKHSYSLNDVESKKIVVNTVTASGTPIVGRPRGGSLKRVKGRTFSVPRSELLKSEPVIPGSPPLYRRNVTDPSVFRRPQAVSPPGMALSAFGRDSQIALRSVSQDYSIGLRRQRPLTSGAVALSTWQHSCHPDGNTYSSLRRRPKRHSIAASDPASTIIGSDDTRVFTSSDEYETDIMTDYWDSIRTRETSGSGLKGLRIETMFDKAGARLSNEEVTTLEELLPRGSFASRLEKDPPLFPESLLPAVPPTGVVDNASISEDEPEARSMIGALPGEPGGPSPQAPLPLSMSSESEGLVPGLPSAKLFPGSPIVNPCAGQKMNIFDWSEHSRAERDASDSEARPRTVHGKQNGIDRGSRAACRKVPSTIHLRSQSVPVARDVPANDSRQASGKFGTWGLGSKGVSEDWDSDFDFDDEEENIEVQNTKPVESDAAPQSMTVPQAILERQASLRGQFGQVQELTLLVEELKRLRHQASVLDLVSGPSSELWKEAEGIVNLATIDDEEDRRSPPGSPSSLTFSFDESDDEALNAPSKRTSEGSWQGTPQQGQLAPSPFRQPKASSEVSSQQESQLYSPPLRQLSRVSPKSKSVLDILQPHQRAESSTLPRFTPTTRPQKLPFDTSSLRNLVVRAGVVTRALKEVIRKAEGVDPSPEDMFPSDPPFRRIFDQPSHDDLASFEAALTEMH
ncbi:uncharacterized protein N7459_009821 [Penicillium hispanicum]|uniref:uncharacterized protein n=1 Tax=Penicillium hispanicum TaxID=1080232 RepID=UPI0025404149|nr:uncharacterized protein N7459_009821 [Penicillium hispanicum]KAJ5570391.1 hypothetical protein N7459_009821 [Penicillium hispanicum]